MEKSLVFLTLSLACVYLIMDDFFGKKRVSKLAQQLTPDVKLPLEDQVKAVVNGAKKAGKAASDAINKPVPSRPDAPGVPKLPVWHG